MISSGFAKASGVVSAHSVIAARSHTLYKETISCHPRLRGRTRSALSMTACRRQWREERRADYSGAYRSAQSNNRRRTKHSRSCFISKVTIGNVVMHVFAHMFRAEVALHANKQAGGRGVAAAGVIVVVVDVVVDLR